MLISLIGGSAAIDKAADSDVATHEAGARDLDASLRALLGE